MAATAVGVTHPGGMHSCYFYFIENFSILAMFIWPPLLRLLIDTYGWRGAYVMVAGICLNAMVPGSLLRPPPMKTVIKVIYRIK